MGEAMIQARKMDLWKLILLMTSKDIRVIENEGMRMYAFVVCRKVTKEAFILTFINYSFGIKDNSLNFNDVIFWLNINYTI